MKKLTSTDVKDIQQLANALNKARVGNNAVWKFEGKSISLSGCSPSEATIIRNRLAKIGIRRPSEKFAFEDKKNCGLICIARPEENGTVKLEIGRARAGDFLINVSDSRPGYDEMMEERMSISRAVGLVNAFQRNR